MTRKTTFFRGGLGSSSIVFTGTRYKLETLHQCGKRVKTKSQNVLGDNSYVCRSYRGKTCMGGGATPPYWIGLREYHDILSDNYFNCKSKDALRTFYPRVLQGHVLHQFQGHQILSWNTFTLVSKFHWVVSYWRKKLCLQRRNVNKICRS